MRLILIAALIAGLANGAFAVDQNLFNMVMALASTVAVVITIIKYLDAKIDHKVKNAIQTITLQLQANRREMRLQISQMRELMGHPPLPKEKESEEEAV